MRLHHIVFKEMWRRKSGLVASLIAVLVGIATIVSVRTIALSSRKKLTDQVHELGANMLIIPASMGVADYHTADFGEGTIPERYAEMLHTSEFAENVHEMIPKLSARTEVNGRAVVLTGVLPKDDFKRPLNWDMPSFIQTGTTHPMPHPPVSKAPDAAAPTAPVVALKYEDRPKRRAFESIGRREIMVGSEIARELGLTIGSTLEIDGRQFHVSRVMEETATVDDVRIFAHLHTVQDMLGKPDALNAIEVVGCGCTKDLVKLGHEIEKLLPGTKVVTIRQIVETQQNTIRMMEAFSGVAMIVVLAIAGAGIANHMTGNVQERRREIATLLAIGAAPLTIQGIFLQKAAVLGLVGGVAGYFLGTGLALGLGPHLLEVNILAQRGLVLWSIAIAVGVNVVFSFVPARNAARMDPAIAMMEV